MVLNNNVVFLPLWCLPKSSLFGHCCLSTCVQYQKGEVGGGWRFLRRKVIEEENTYYILQKGLLQRSRAHGRKLREYRGGSPTNIENLQLHTKAIATKKKTLQAKNVRMATSNTSKNLI